EMAEEYVDPQEAQPAGRLKQHVQPLLTATASRVVEGLRAKGERTIHRAGAAYTRARGEGQTLEEWLPGDDERPNRVGGRKTEDGGRRTGGGRRRTGGGEWGGGELGERVLPCGQHPPGAWPKLEGHECDAVGGEQDSL